MDDFLSSLIGILTYLLAGSAASNNVWIGTVVVDGMVHEPGGYHPYTTTISLRLRESDREPLEGGFRVPLISDGSTSDVQHALYLTDGLLVCSGTGTETLTDDMFGYLETKAGRTTYHLAIPRAFGAFACGQNRSVKANRIVVIGRGDHESATIETEDSVLRLLDERGSLMRGSFESKKSRGAVWYEYKITWSVTRAAELR